MPVASTVTVAPVSISKPPGGLRLPSTFTVPKVSRLPGTAICAGLPAAAEWMSSVSVAPAATVVDPP